MPLCHSGGEVSIIQNLFRCPTNGIAVLGAQMKLGDVVPQMTSYFLFQVYIFYILTLQEINVSHLGKRKIIFKYALSGGYVNSLEGI